MSDKQKSAAPIFVLEDYIPYLLHQGHRGVLTLFEQVLVDEAITLAEWRVLAVLISRKLLRMSELSAATCIEPPTLARIVSGMESKNWVKREPSKTDRRAINVKASSTGKDIAKKIIPHAKSIEDMCVHGLSEDEIDFLRKLLKRLMCNVGTSPVPSSDPIDSE